MAAATETVTLSTSAYQALSSGQETVLVWAECPTRIHIGTSLPAAGTDNWFPMATGQEMQFLGMGGSDVVYAYPDSGSGKVRVLRK